MRLVPASLTALLAATLVASSSLAQPAAWLPVPSEADAASLTVRRVILDREAFPDGDIYSAATSVWFAGARLGVAPRVQVVADLPFAHAEFDEEVPGLTRESGAQIGNPFLGVEAQASAEGLDLALGLGARAPVVSDASPTRESLGSEYGLLADYDRIGAFLPGTLSLVGTARARFSPTPELSVVGGLTPQVLVPVGDGSSGETQFAGGYAFRAEASAGPALVSVGASGAGVLGASAGRLARFEHAFGFAAELAAGSVRPGAFVVLPVGGGRPTEVTAIAGVGLSYRFR